MPTRLELSTSDIRRMYIDEHLGTAQVASSFNCSLSTIRKRLREMDIKVERRISPQIDIPADKLAHLYLDEHLGTSKIAKTFGCAYSTILRRLDDAGIPRRSPHEYRGEYAANWKGGRNLCHGYVKIYEPENQHTGYRGYIYEHLKVWEQAHQKKLPKGWVIHHLNGLKHDNRPSNLVAMPSKKHFALMQIYRQKIRNLEAEISQLKKVLEDRQSIFYIGEN